MMWWPLCPTLFCLFGYISYGGALRTTESPCPEGMKLYHPTNKCYVRVIQEKTWQEAQDFCHSIYPEAYIMEIRSASEQRLLSYFIGLADDGSMSGTTVWLGAKNKPNDDYPDYKNKYFYWESNDDRVDLGFNYFSSSDPDLLSPEGPLFEACVRAIPEEELRWWDTDCTFTHQFICSTERL